MKIVQLESMVIKEDSNHYTLHIALNMAGTLCKIGTTIRVPNLVGYM
jgi:hypothetical protein